LFFLLFFLWGGFVNMFKVNLNLLFDQKQFPINFFFIFTWINLQKHERNFL